MRGKLGVELRTPEDAADAAVLVRLSGVLDEDNQLAEATSKLYEALVVVDCAGVRRINSCGVRDWVDWVGEMESRGNRLVLVACSSHIVDQVNMVHNFCGQGKIRSVQAPYYCRPCDHEATVLIALAEVPAPADMRPTCARCGGAMALDHIPEQYFAFLQDGRSVLTDAATERLVAAAVPETAERIRALDGGGRSPSEPTRPVTPTPTSDDVEAAPEGVTRAVASGEMQPSAPDSGGGGQVVSPVLTVVLVAAMVVVISLMLFLVFEA